VSASTTIASGKDARILLENASNVMVDISGSSNEYKIDLTDGLGKYFVFADDFQRVVPGGKSASITLTALYSPTGGEGFDLLTEWEDADDREVRYLIIDVKGAAGHRRWEGYVAVEKLSTGAKAGNGHPPTAAATLTSHGEFSWNTITT